MLLSDGVMVPDSGASKALSSEELLSMAAENMKGNIKHPLRQLKARKVRGEVKLRSSRVLIRDVEP